MVILIIVAIVLGLATVAAFAIVAPSTDIYTDLPIISIDDFSSNEIEAIETILGGN